MNTYESIKTVIYKTIHRNKKPIDLLAEEMGIDTNSLYRYALPAPSGSDIPLKRLVPLMKAAGDYSILKHIATVCGFVIVKLPYFKASKGDSNSVVSSYQKASADAVKNMIDFFDEPTSKKYKAVTESLQNIMEESVGAQKYINKEFAGQVDLFE